MQKKTTGCYPCKGDGDHIHASPPCQGFSDANRTGGKNDDKNNELSFQFLKAVKFFRPATASLENVIGFVSNLEVGKSKSKKSAYCKRIVEELLKLGYQVRVCILVSSDYGDPQKRPRVFLSYSRNGCIASKDTRRGIASRDHSVRYSQGS